MNVEEHYRNLFKTYGDTYQAAQWSNKETQEKRFAILTEIENLEGKKVLDFGCGTGDLSTYFKKIGINVNYTGVDIVNELLECAKEKHPEQRFGQLEDFEHETFDYILISGVFNNKMSNNVEFYQNTLLKLKKMCKEGIAFNMLSKYVDYYDEHLFYEYPETVFKFAKEHITQYIALRNEYRLKQNVIPFEFTMYLYMKE